MTPELKQRLAKIYELVQRGTDGEKQAAKNLLDKIIAKHNLEGIDLDNLDKEEYRFTYTSKLELKLLSRIIIHLVNPDIMDDAVQSVRLKRVVIYSNYNDYITIECAYEYFRRHMKQQWKIACLPEVNKCRKAKTKNKRREQLSMQFLNQYLIASNLYRPDEIELTEIDLNSLSDKERKDRARIGKVQGGQYSVQVINGLLLNEKNT